MKKYILTVLTIVCSLQAFSTIIFKDETLKNLNIRNGCLIEIYDSNGKELKTKFLSRYVSPKHYNFCLDTRNKAQYDFLKQYVIAHEGNIDKEVVRCGHSCMRVTLVVPIEQFIIAQREGFKVLGVPKSFFIVFDVKDNLTIPYNTFFVSG